MQTPEHLVTLSGIDILMRGLHLLTVQATSLAEPLPCVSGLSLPRFLYSNNFTTLPAGLFDGLEALEYL